MDRSIYKYQEKAISSLYKKWQNSPKIVLLAPTGSGKTRMTAYVISQAVAQGGKVLFCVHRDTLIQQAVETLASFGLDCGRISGNYQEKREASIQVASVQSLPNRQWWQDSGFSLIVFDECHRTLNFRGGKQVLKAFPNASFLGLTATPWMAGRTQLGDLFDDFVSAPLPQELIKKGLLSKLECYGFADYSQDSLIVNRGEYTDESLSIAFNTPSMIKSLFDNWVNLAQGLRTICRPVNCSHAHAIADYWNSKGFTAAAITGSMPHKERRACYQALKDGSLTLLASYDCLTEGFDVPEVSCVMHAGKSMSHSTVRQLWGRGMRIAPWIGKEHGILLDQGMNVGCSKEQHGTPNWLERWALPTSKDRDAGLNPPPLKFCPSCRSMVSASVATCSCGYEFPIEGKEKIEVVGEFEEIEIDPTATPRDFYAKCLRIAYSKKYLPTWAVDQFRRQHGFYPRTEWGRCAIFGPSPTDENKSEYLNHLLLTTRSRVRGKAGMGMRYEVELVKRFYGIEFACVPSLDDTLILETLDESTTSEFIGICERVKNSGKD